MSMEIKLTDIRGEPPLKVGEFILDKDNNVMYVGSGNFELTRNGGAEIGVIGRFIPFPANTARISIQDKSYIKFNISCKFIPQPSYNTEIKIHDNSNINITVSAKFTPLNTYRSNINVQDNSNIVMKGSGKNVT